MRVKLRGADISFDRSGEGVRFVWGHGLTSSRADEDAFGLIDWADVRQSADVTRYDARGHGESELTTDREGYGWDALAEDQRALMDHLGIGSAVIGGASMGAATALHQAVQAPERVDGLVLVIPPTAWETRAAQTDLYLQMADVVERVGVEPLIAASAEMPPPDPFVGDERWRDRRAASLRSTDPTRLAGVFRGASTADLPSRDAISAITSPALVLAWTGDPGHPVSTAEQLVDLLPRAELSLASDADELATWTHRVSAFLAG